MSFYAPDLFSGGIVAISFKLFAGWMFLFLGVLSLMPLRLTENSSDVTRSFTQIQTDTLPGN
jgi:hypothetical protein